MIHTVEPQEVPDIVDICEPANVNVGLMGSPGTGKTFSTVECARRISMRKNNGKEMPLAINRPKKDGEYSVIQLNSTYLDPQDFVMPDIDVVEKVYNRYVIGSFPRTPYNLLSFEELAKNPDTFKIASQIMNEGRLGFDYVLPDHTYIMFTSNSATDRAGSFDLHTDLINRVEILNVVPTARGFCEVHDGELAPDIRAFLKWFPDLIMTFDSGARAKPFASPRSIFKLNEMMTKSRFDPMKHKHADPVMLGLVGETFTAEFKAVLRASVNLGDLDGMMNDPEAHKDDINQLKDNTSHNGRQMICSLVIVLAKRTKREPSQFNKIVKFLEMLDDETAVTFTHVAHEVNPKVEQESEFGRFHARHSNEFYF